MLDFPRVYTFGDFKLDAANRAVERLSDRTPVKLGRMAFGLLLYLLKQNVIRPGQAVPSEELFENVWRARRGGDAIDFQIGQIKKLIGKEWIVRGAGGYHFCGEVKTEEPCLSARPLLGDVPDHTQYFIGREPELELLAGILPSAKPSSVRCVLTGAAGVGKTELALQFTFMVRARRLYPGGIFWLNGRSSDVRVQLAVSVGARLGVPAGTLADRCAAVIRHLESGEQRVLIVLDDAVGMEGLPRAPHIDWLLTACSWPSEPTMRSFAVGPLSPEEASTLVTALADRDVNPGLKELVEYSKGHALLLTQAGCFLRDHDMTARNWIDEQEDRS